MYNTEYKYYNFKQRVTDSPNLLTMEEISKFKADPNKDYYMSIFRYNDKHKDLCYKKVDSQTGQLKPSVKGKEFWDVITNVLVWDFDNKKNPELARQDTIELAHRLVDNYQIDPENISVYYSGNKGFHISILLDRDITQTQFKQITSNIVNGLKTYDPSVCDPPRLLRMEHTKNLATGLYKIPLDVHTLDTSSMEVIKELAKEPKEDYNISAVKLPEQLFVIKEKDKIKPTVESLLEFDPRTTPKGWKTHKWALAQGFFDEGERHTALMIVAATCRSLGYDSEYAYYMCKAALKKQARRTGQDEFDKKELWENIIEESIFNDGWNGGNYGPDHPWVKAYCSKMGFQIESENDGLPCIDLNSLTDVFIDYATNFEQNIIKTGIEELDENIMYSTSTLNGVLGQPGAGKTSWALKYLRNTSNLYNINSLFISADMGAPLVYGKMVQENTGLPFKNALELYRSNPDEAKKIGDNIKQVYRNVGFNFRSGLTVPDIKDIYLRHCEIIGKDVKLIVIDYLECLSGPYADVTANAGHIANQLKDLANELEVCIVLLLQTQKHSTPDIADPLLSMKQIKGSSIIEQACSTVLTLWREGYSPNHVQYDKYISFAVVKNRFGSQWKGDFFWEAVKGDIRSLTPAEKTELNNFKEKKKQERIKAIETGDRF